MERYTWTYAFSSSGFHTHGTLTLSCTRRFLPHTTLHAHASPCAHFPHHPMNVMPLGATGAACFHHPTLHHMHAFTTRFPPHHLLSWRLTPTTLLRLCYGHFAALRWLWFFTLTVRRGGQIT